MQVAEQNFAIAFPPTNLSPPSPPPSASRHKRPSSKPSTPRVPSDVPQTSKPRSESKRVKPNFTTCLNYPQHGLTPALTLTDDANLQRNQRRSKQEALTKLDRQGTPVAVASGPTATSFLPQQETAGPSGPSSSRNPLRKPPITNPPFHLDSVRTEAPRHPPSRSGTRLFGLEECPSFYPTAEQFLDPLAYIDSIGAEAKPYGICKVIPPEGWRMPFSLETDTFKFKTRLQRLNSLEAASRAKVNFLEQLTMYHLQQGDHQVTTPVVDHKPVDLWHLRKEVTRAGGFDELNRSRGWNDLAIAMGYHHAYALHLKAAYVRIILPFDAFAIRAKSTTGSPLTPLTNTGMTRPPGFVGESPASPTRKGRMGAVPRKTIPTHTPHAYPKSASPPTGNSLLDKLESIASAMPSSKIKVPGFNSSRDDSESELSDDELSPGAARKAAAAPPEYQKGEVCEVCRGGHAPEKILLCDGCDRGFHIYCLDPPLAAVPTNEEWFCTACLLSQGDDFGFEEGEEHSIPSYQARDAAFAYAWWNKHRPSSSSLPEPLGRSFGKVVVSEDDVEREFWRLTESSSDTVEVEYGADVHSTTHGSGAPTTETHPLDPYSVDGWNLNNMPILPDSLLRYIKSDISGMTVPWIYIGMLFSTFCWHNEDHYTYSVNYMFWGETKTWYGIPGSDADKFEEAIKSEAPELFEQQPSLLYQLVTMMNPGRLNEKGVKVVACDQRPNEFVITFPKAYHCGFNHGINFNEAVNFALPDWLPEGNQSVTRYKQHAKAPVFSHHELLITITLFSESIKTAIWLRDSLEAMVKDETSCRDKLRATVPHLNETHIEEDVPEDQYQCCICKGFSYLAQITCSCTCQVACVDHADQLCGCQPEKRTLRKRYSDEQLHEILSAIQARASQPQAWRSRFFNLLEAPRPQLKSMRAILADGEKVPYHLPEVHDLRALVDRANSWVDRITTLSTRKPTARRRKGRQEEETDEPDRDPQVLYALLREAEKLAFDSPEIMQLRQILLSIEGFRQEASAILATPENELKIEQCRTTLILGTSLNLDMPEIPRLQAIVDRLQWFKRVDEDFDDRTVQYGEILELLADAEHCQIPDDHEAVVELRKREAKGLKWKTSVDELLSSKDINLDQVSALIDVDDLIPTSIEVVRQLENIRKTAIGWQTTAEQQLSSKGTAIASQRLCKAVKSAQGPLGRIQIPAISKLQTELDWHAKWNKEMSEALGCSLNKVAYTLQMILLAFRSHMDPSDDEPNADHSCFCRATAAAQMVICSVCDGAYHPKCVGVHIKNVDKPFECGMCIQASLDDRPSLNKIATFIDTNKWAFIFAPADQTTVAEFTDVAVRFAGSLLKACEPININSPSRDVDLLSHMARKMFTLPLIYDALNSSTNERIIFEDWIHRRLHEARKLKLAVKETVGKPSTLKGKPRPRRPKLLLKQVMERVFKCICDRPEREPESTATCPRCQQGYHAECVRAPDLSSAKFWRCPCCAVREAKAYIKDFPVRVQTTENLGTDTYIDYRATISGYSMTLIEVEMERLPADQYVLLECTKFVPPLIPEGFSVPHNAPHGTWAPDAPPSKKRKIDEAAKSDAAPITTPPASAVAQPAQTNGHSTTQAQAVLSNGIGPSTPPIPRENGSSSQNAIISQNGSSSQVRAQAGSTLPNLTPQRSDTYTPASTSESRQSSISRPTDYRSNLSSPRLASTLPMFQSRSYLPNGAHTRNIFDLRPPQAQSSPLHPFGGTPPIARSWGSHQTLSSSPWGNPIPVSPVSSWRPSTMASQPTRTPEKTLSAPEQATEATRSGVTTSNGHN